MSDTQTKQPRSRQPFSATPFRQRIASSNIPRTYSGQYGQGGQSGDLLPFELTVNRNTEWLISGGSSLFLTYIFIIILAQLFLLTILPLSITFTVTNVGHGFLTMMYLHWIKGSPNFYEQGEMNGMTLWEQIASNPKSTTKHRRILIITPTVLCYLACHFAGYDKLICMINLCVWVGCVLAKMEFMNGVRILGINRTIGIDD